MQNPATSCSLLPEDHDASRQSQWLQVTLSDMNERIKAMMTLLQEKDSHETYYTRRQDMVQMLEEFNRCYNSLATEYDQLRNKLNKSSFREPSDRAKFEIFNIEDANAECDSSISSDAWLNQLPDELLSTKDCKMKVKMNMEIRENQGTGFSKTEHTSMKMVQATVGDFSEISNDSEGSWCELKFQVTNLMEENLQKLAELARRNVEKKLIIDKLQLQLERVKGENRALQSCIGCLKVGDKCNNSRKSHVRGVFPGKIFGGGCS